MRYWTFLFVFLPVLGFSQCKDFDKLDFGGTRESKTRNHIPFDLNITDTIKYCCDIRKIQTHADFILAKARAFIVGRTNEAFYRRLEINQVDVNYPKSVTIAYQNQSLYNLSTFDISYWIIYTYSNSSYFPIDGMLLGNQGRPHNYHFTTEIHTVFTYQAGQTE